ncbi:MAG: ADOP family duplicated permease [Blastocatellia bacterium]
MLRRLFHRLRSQLRRTKIEREMEAELRFHLEMETAENIRRGMGEEEARFAAQRSFGGLAQTKEAYRDVARFRWIEDLGQDLRYGARMLGKHRGFTAVAVLTLALGIGANTAIFTVVNGVLIRSLPYRDASRLVRIEKAFIDLENPYAERSAFGWKERTRSFEQIAAYGAYDGGVNLTGGGEAERIEARDVSANFFETLGVRAVAGRVFGPDEEKQAVAVISHGLWQRRFAGDPNAIGQTLHLNGKSFTIIGVAPPALQYPAKLDVWIPLSLDLKEHLFTSPIRGHGIVARLAPDVTLVQARSEMKLLSEQIKLREPLVLRPLLESLTGSIRRPLVMLLVAVGLVLLIACANVANLLLARGATRRKEIAMRAALGAGRGRLIRQSLTESLLIGALGGLAGLGAAIWLRRLLIAYSPPEIPRLDEVTLDYRVLAFNAALALLTGVLVGLLPAIRGSKTDLLDALKDGGQKAGDGARALSLKGLLVAGEIALSLILLIGAGLLLRSFSKVLSVDAGFERDNILTVSLALPRKAFAERAKIHEFYRQLTSRIAAIPGVKAVGTTNKIPLSRENVFGLLFEVEGGGEAVPVQESFALFLSVSPDYFRAMGISVLQGRAFTERDDQTAPPVLIVNHLMARRFFPAGDALGKRVKLAGEKVPREIVGVVGAAKSLGLEEEPNQEMFLPYPQGGNPPTALAIRIVGDPLAIVPAVRDAVRQSDPDLPPYDIKTIGQRISESVARRRFIASLMSLFALLALALAATGIYGVISYLVTLRTHEISIRIALGASRRNVIGLILKRGIALALIGIVIGLAGAIALTRLIKTLLFGVNATEPAVFLGTALLLASIALLAAYIPAHRATRINPLTALRHE